MVLFRTARAAVAPAACPIPMQAAWTRNAELARRSLLMLASCHDNVLTVFGNQ